MSEPIDPPQQRPARSLRTGLIVVAVVVALVGAVWFLVSSFEAEPPTRSELISAYESSGTPTAQAECVADAILGNLSDDEVSLIVERGPSGAPIDAPKVDDETIDQTRAALGACRDLVPPTTEPGQGTDDQRPVPTTSTTTANPPTTGGAAFDTAPSTTAVDTTSTTTVAG